MSAKVRWCYRAIHEAQEAYDWYQAHSKGTGERSITELDEHIAFLLEHPTGYPKCCSIFRKVTLKNFPYQVIYRFEKDTVFSIFHSSRNPSQWGALVDRIFEDHEIRSE